jgi:hypothetical protein
MDGNREGRRRKYTSGGGIEGGLDGEARLVVAGGVIAEEAAGEGAPAGGGGRGGAPCEVGGDASACDPEHGVGRRRRLGLLVSSPALRGIGWSGLVERARSIPASQETTTRHKEEREKRGSGVRN